MKPQFACRIVVGVADHFNVSERSQEVGLQLSCYSRSGFMPLEICRRFPTACARSIEEPVLVVDAST